MGSCILVTGRESSISMVEDMKVIKKVSREKMIKYAHVRNVVISFGFLVNIGVVYIITKIMINRQETEAFFPYDTLLWIRMTCMFISLLHLVFPLIIRRNLVKNRPEGIEAIIERYTMINGISIVTVYCPVVYGFCTALMSKDLSVYNTFALISLIGILMYFPRKRKLEEFVKGSITKE